jgi:hypothetical protein
VIRNPDFARTLGADKSPGLFDFFISSANHSVAVETLYPNAFIVRKIVRIHDLRYELVDIKNVASFLGFVNGSRSLAKELSKLGLYRAPDRSLPSSSFHLLIK